MLRTVVSTLGRQVSKGRVNVAAPMASRMAPSLLFSASMSSSKEPTSKNTEEKSGGDADLWAWIPPRDKIEQHDIKQTYQLPVKKGQLPTKEEVAEYLRSNGGQDVLILPLSAPIVNVTHFVIVSAPSTRLIRQLAETISENLKHRELFHVQGASGVEGDRNDDWQLVDCETFFVQLFIPSVRTAIDLESHWTMPVRPHVPYCRTEAEYDREFDKLLEKYPPPSVPFNITMVNEDFDDVNFSTRGPEKPIKVL